MTPADIVLDASALVRGLLRESEEATDIVELVAEGLVSAHAPDLIGPETTSALLRLVRAGRSTPEAAAAMLEASTSTGIVRHPSAQLSRPALELALTTGLSPYDAFYAVLAEALDLPLVTADRRLAAVVDGAQLL